MNMTDETREKVVKSIDELMKALNCWSFEMNDPAVIEGLESTKADEILSLV